MEKGFIFDLDGTIYLDEDMIEGADEAIATLKERGDKVVFLTNKSIASRRDYVDKLNGMGIQVELEEVVNSNFMTAKYLEKKLGSGESAYVIGEEPLFDELEEAGISMTEDHENARFVVLGWDRKFTYEKINKAFQAWKNGAEIIATNPDRTCPISGGGEIPDCAAMIGALEGVTGEKISKVTGKPSLLMAEYVVNELLHLPASQCYMVGDRLETDIKMANEANIHSVLVMTGIADTEMIEKSADKPSFILDSVKDIVTL